jgi:hypothetical protein
MVDTNQALELILAAATAFNSQLDPVEPMLWTFARWVVAITFLMSAARGLRSEWRRWREPDAPGPAEAAKGPRALPSQGHAAAGADGRPPT